MQGERRFFRICFNWLAKNHPEHASFVMDYIPMYRRWDDLIYSCLDTPLEEDMFTTIGHTLMTDLQHMANGESISLLAKWMPSENASSKITKRAANILRTYMCLSHKQYRVLLSQMRNYIKVLERLMSDKRWDEIEFDKISSNAGLKYANAFLNRPETKERWTQFIENKKTKVKANTLYPYEIVKKILNDYSWYSYKKLDPVTRQTLEKYWENLPDYFNGKQSNILCVVDTSGSMYGDPINVAISLGMYTAERAGGPFKDHFISFSRNPKLIKIEGADFVDKVERIYRQNLCENTNLTGVFDLLLSYIISGKASATDLPDTIVVISDMEIDYMAEGPWRHGINNINTEMEKIRQIWTSYGVKMPKLVYWNVDARQNTILEKGENISFVSGLSPSTFKSIITGKTGVELMLDALLSERYENIFVME